MLNVFLQIVSNWFFLTCCIVFMFFLSMKRGRKTKKILVPGSFGRVDLDMVTIYTRPNLEEDGLLIFDGNIFRQKFPKNNHSCKHSLDREDFAPIKLMVGEEIKSDPILSCKKTGIRVYTYQITSKHVIVHNRHALEVQICRQRT
jgi:hypothetical protein